MTANAAPLAPVPERLAVAVPGVPEAVAVSVAAFVPVVFGASPTPTLHFPPAGSGLPEQPSEAIEKSTPSVPLSATATFPVAALPVFVSVNVAGAETAPMAAVPRSCVEGANESAPRPPPTPDSATVADPPGSEVKDSVASSEAVFVGLKWTCTLQLLPAGSALSAHPSESIPKSPDSPPRARRRPRRRVRFPCW